MSKGKKLAVLGALVAAYLSRGGYLTSFKNKIDNSPIKVVTPDGDENLSVLIFKEPVAVIKAKVEPIRGALSEGAVVKEMLLDVAYFYHEFASIVRRDVNHIVTNQQFAHYQALALELAFSGKTTPGIGEMIEVFLQEETGLEPDTEINKVVIPQMLDAIAWAAYEGTKL